jgi:hypothetical protein
LRPFDSEEESPSFFYSWTELFSSAEDYFDEKLRDSLPSSFLWIELGASSEDASSLIPSDPFFFFLLASLKF